MTLSAKVLFRAIMTRSQRAKIFGKVVVIFYKFIS